MKKSDLKQNMIVETRDGDRYLVLEDVDTLLYRGRLFFMSNNGFLSDDVYSEELSDRGNESEYDIVKVMKWKQFKGLECLNAATIDEFEVLWERPEQVNWQPWELEVLKHIPSDLGGIGIDSHGKAYVMKNETGIYGYPLKLNLPSLQAYSNKEFSRLNIDKELERYNMKREKTQEE